MSPSTPTPSDLLESLTLDSQMSSTTSDVNLRAIEIRDVLSSFDRNVLPAEFKPQVFAQLDRSSHDRPPISQWTIQEDLQSTLLQWASYSDAGYEFIRRLQSSSTLARCFHEKLARRFQELFQLYDRSVHEYERAPQAEIQQIARGIRDVVAAVREDRPYRELGQEAIAMRLLEAMIDVCQRHIDIIPYSEPPSTPSRTTRRSTIPSAEGPLNLYEALIKVPSNDQSQGLFMLDVLEMFPATVFANLQSQHSRLMRLLEANDAPREYMYRIGRLVSRADSEEIARESSAQSPSGSTSRRIPFASSSTDLPPPTSTSSRITTETEIQAAGPAQTTPTSSSSTKRSAENTDSVTRRGKKKTAH